MKSLRVVSWNTLNNSRSENYPEQKDRLTQLAKEVASVFESDVPTIVHLSEITNSSHIRKIAQLSGVAGLTTSPTMSYSRKEWMGFITNIPHVSYSPIKYPTPTYKHSGQQARIGNVTVYGVHMPYKIFVDAWHRIQIANFLRLRTRGTSTSFIVGDFNVVSIQPSRMLLRLSHYRNALPLKHKAFPTPYYRGKHLPKLTPRLPIDAQYYRSARITDWQTHYNNASDHPILICDYQILKP